MSALISSCVRSGGFIFADTYGYGLSKTLIGATVLIIALVLYFYRRTVQDRLPMQWRDPGPAVPSQAASAEAG